MRNLVCPLSYLGGVYGRVHEEVEYLFVVNLHVGDGHAEGGFDSSVHFLKHVRQRSRGYAAVLRFELDGNQTPIHEREKGGGNETGVDKFRHILVRSLLTKEMANI